MYDSCYLHKEVSSAINLNLIPYIYSPGDYKQRKEVNNVWQIGKVDVENNISVNRDNL